MKKIVAFVPIKLNNERCPGKNTWRFSDGTPLMAMIQRALNQCGEISEKYVFCSDPAVCEYLEPGFTFLQREKELDGPQATSQDIISSFVKKVDADIYVLSHATAPFVRPDRIACCVEKVSREGYDSAFTAEKIQRLLWSDGKPLNFDAACVPRTQDLPPIYSELSAAYVFEKDVFLKTGRRIGEHPYICVCDGVECLDIDYPDDLVIADAIYRKKQEADKA